MATILDSTENISLSQTKQTVEPDYVGSDSEFMLSGKAGLGKLLCAFVY